MLLESIARYLTLMNGRLGRRPDEEAADKVAVLSLHDSSCTNGVTCASHVGGGATGVSVIAPPAPDPNSCCFSKWR